MTRVARRGFTLIELLLVLVILAVLAALVVPKFTGRAEQARQTAADSELRIISNAINQFEVDTGRYPTSDEGLNALLQAPGDVQNWHGPYLDKNSWPVDPWGTQYVYKYPGTHNTNGFDLYSLGPDKREGNDDRDNWSQKK